MFDPLSLVVGAAIFVAGALTGRIRRRLSGPRTRPPICGCGHGLAMHNRDTSICHAEVQRDTLSGVTFVPCRCQRYVGPEHILDVWTPPAASGPPPPRPPLPKG